MADIKHIFVLMMENRSFDHFFGCTELKSQKPIDLATWGFKCGAADRLPEDLPHEFDDVRKQISNGSMTGFRENAGELSLVGFSPDELVIHTLAKEFVLFDNWYSSMPGPTWPNRFFVHAASSGGLQDSPSDWTCVESETIDSLGFSFSNGTIYDALEQAGKSWRVYRADAFPQILAVKGIVQHLFSDDHFRDIDDQDPDGDEFKEDLKNGDCADYTFIEPSFGLYGAAPGLGNAQHPTGSVAAGESFIRHVYESIRNSPVWSNSVLLITWDEHGGFFDHLPPSTNATPPGDKPTNEHRAEDHKFSFTQLGVRVPALLISPWAPKGKLGSELFSGKAFDHASVVASVRQTFSISKALTDRDRVAPNWVSAYLPEVRPDNDAGPQEIALKHNKQAVQLAPTDSVQSKVSQRLIPGFLQIARTVELQMQGEQAPGFVQPKSESLQVTAENSLEYIRAVAQRAEKHPRRGGARARSSRDL